MHLAIERVQAAIRALQAGKMIILMDHPDRENEGDLIFPAEATTPEKINFMIRNGSGIICLSLLAQQLKKLNLGYMVAPHENSSRSHTPFTVSIEAKEGVSTGVSAKDRTTTILTAINDNTVADDLVRPGHIFPLHAREGGVLERQGHTEGAIDIVKLAGFKPTAVLCEVMNEDGSMAKGAQLTAFAEQHQLPLLSIEDLIHYRLCCEDLIADKTSADLPLEQYGNFKMTVIREKINSREHIILSKPCLNSLKSTLVRIHSSCTTGDLFKSRRCDCNSQLNYALQRLSEEGGLLIYLNQEGRGVGLFNKIKAYALQETGIDTVEANQNLGLPVDSRDYYIAAAILRNFNINQIRLLTNNPAKLNSLINYGVMNVTMETMPIFCNEQNIHYLTTKKEKLNHIIN